MVIFITIVYLILCTFAPPIWKIEFNLVLPVSKHISTNCKPSTIFVGLRSVSTVVALLLSVAVWVLMPKSTLALNPYTYSSCDNIVFLHLTLGDSDSVYLNPGNGTCPSTGIMPGEPLPQAQSCSSEYDFAGWSPVPVTDDGTSIPNPLYSPGDICPSTSDTLYAVYKKCVGNDTYRYKIVTSDTNDWTGEYLIVNQDYKVFDGNKTNPGITFSGNYISNWADTLSITGGITSNTTTDAARFIISGSTNNWQIQSASGLYIYANTGNDNLQTNTSPSSTTAASISFNSGGSVEIISNSNYHLRFRPSNPNGNRFRFCKANHSSYPSTEPIYLYRKVSNYQCYYNTYPIIDIPTITIIGDHEFCDGGSTILTTSCFPDNNLTYSWSNGLGNQSYTPPITSSGTYTVTVTHLATNCVGSESWTVTVNEPQHQHYQTTICADLLPYTFHGHVFNGADTQTGHTPSAVTGCDSTWTLTVNVNPSYHQSEDETICQSQLPFTWRDTIFQTGTTSGDYVFHRNSISGCDSVVTLHLTINPSYSITLSPTICENATYTFLDTTVAEAGTYTRTGQTIHGCDSTVTIILSVSSEYRDTIHRSICHGTTYHFGNRDYDATGVYADTTQTPAGCDSITVLHLTVEDYIRVSVSDTVCHGGSFILGSRVLTESGIYADTTQTLAGCDSITTLTLTVEDYIRDTIYHSICHGTTAAGS